MNRISLNFLLIIYIFFSSILKKNFVLNTQISRNLNAAKLNILERILIGQGLQLPVASSWQLLLILLSDNNSSLSIAQDINEFFKTKGKIEKDLAKSFEFYFHPAMNISSSVLVHPKSEFLDFVFKFIDTINFMGSSKHKNITLLINDRRNLVACRSMLKKMLKDGFVLGNSDYETTAQNRLETTKNLGKTAQKNLEYSIDHFCKSYLIMMVELFEKIANMKKNSIKNLHSKALLYNKICKLLD
ncbi:uncharacterized protein ELE39_001709 [Cryptosporidium sp. chipmunk genotype I]|uniref:uncharacterized protein n=1 Tax=Cryptosporidium sp. chipmunk genotype I TaxID=1280935 RepID=UPI00351A5028|nr:hypothetical protein ELE39_001709 [Cryptosporidium sp. chipmunk genotype I]